MKIDLSGKFTPQLIFSESILRKAEECFETSLANKYEQECERAND